MSGNRICALLLLLCVACAKADANDDNSTDVLARIDDVVITVSEFEDLLSRKAPYVRARYNSIDARKEFLDSLVRTEVLAKEARARGLDKDPDVIRATKQVMIQKLMKAEFEDKIKPEDVSEDEMRAYFNEHAEEFNRSEQVRVSAVIVKSKSIAETVAAAARSEAGRSNSDFRDLVDKYSTDITTKSRGGDLRYFDKNTKEVPPAVVEAAFAIKQTGDVAGPIAAKGNYYIIKQTGRRPPMARSFEDVKKQIQNQLYRQKRVNAQEAFIAELKKNAKIEVYDKVLKKIRPDTTKHGQATPPPSDDLPVLPGGAVLETAPAVP
jgi:peptidyl-prolyl cis-trans isomerase C